MIFIGVDPGLGGALAVMAADGTVLSIQDQPVLELQRREKKRPVADVVGMAYLIQNQGPPATWVLEEPPVQPLFSRASNYQQGWNTALWVGLLTMAGESFVRVSPLTWKAKMLPRVKGKAASRQYAMQRWPTVADQLRRVKDDGRADALLLAEYGRTVLGGEADTEMGKVAPPPPIAPPRTSTLIQGAS